jgi:hypothetical protein
MAVSTLAELPIDTPAIIERFLGAKPESHIAMRNADAAFIAVLPIE